MVDCVATATGIVVVVVTCDDCAAVVVDVAAVVVVVIEKLSSDHVCRLTYWFQNAQFLHANNFSAVGVLFCREFVVFQLFRSGASGVVPFTVRQLQLKQRAPTFHSVSFVWWLTVAGARIKKISFERTTVLSQQHTACFRRDSFTQITIT